MSWSALRQAVRLSRLGKHSEALARADLLLTENHADPRIYYQLALVQLEADQVDQAWQTLELADPLGPDSPVLSLYRALVLGQMERWDEGLEQAELLQRQCPHHQFTASLLCYLYLGQGEVGKALQPLEIGKPAGWVSWFRPELAAFPPLLSRLLLQLELILLPLEFSQLDATPARPDPKEVKEPAQKTPFLQEAQELLQKLSLRALTNSILGLYYQRKGIHYWEKGLTCVEITAWQRCWAWFLSRFGVRRDYSDPAKRHRYLEKALLAQRRAVELEPLQFRGHYHLGEALLYASTTLDNPIPNSERLQEAEKCFVNSWAQEGPNPYLYFYLGRTVQLLGQPAAARTYFERAIEKFEKFPEAHYALGQVHLLMGQSGLARDWLKKSVSSDFLPVARERLHELHQAFEQGKLASRPAMPPWPPVAPTVDSDPTGEDPQSTQTPLDATPESTESHRCEDLASPLENHETCPDPSGPPSAEHLASPPEPEPAATHPPD